MNNPDVRVLGRVIDTADETRKLLSEDGWLALTPSGQWVRELHTELMDGPGVLPQAMSVANWVERLWQQLAMQGNEFFATTGIVSARQEQALWHRVLQKDEMLEIQGRSPATPMAQMALDAWDRSVLYELSLDEMRTRLQGDLPVLDRLSDWVKQFRQLCQQANLISRAEAMQKLAEYASEKTVRGESGVHWPGVVLYGFAPSGGEALGPEPTPLLRKLLGIFADEVVQRIFETEDRPAVNLYKANNLDQELAAAANWAREHGDAKMQIIVPNLAQNLERVRRILTEHLGSQPASRRWALRLEPAVAETPVFRSFVHWLELQTHPLPAERVLSLLRSGLPAVASDDKSDTSRTPAAPQRVEDCTWVEQRLRRELKLQYDAVGLQQQLAALRHLRQAPRQWLDQLDGMLQRLQQLPDRTSLAEWARTLYSELRAMGGLDVPLADKPLSDALTDLLAQMEGLDAVLPGEQMGLKEALFWLQWLAADARLPGGKKDADIWVGSGLDARPIPVDATWIVGFDAGTWPRVTGGNPLLPAAEQREKSMPGADPQHSYEFSQHLLRRLISRSDEVMLSLSPASGGEVHEFSPLLVSHGGGEMLLNLWGDVAGKPGREPLPVCLTKLPQWQDRERLECRQIVDVEEGLPAWTAKEKLQTSYIRMLQLQFTDPLAAFFAGRLGAEPLRRAAQEINAMTIGTVLHGVLEKLLPEGTRLDEDCYRRIARGDEVEQLLEQEFEETFPGVPGYLRRESLAVLKERILGWVHCERASPALGGTVLKTEMELEGIADCGIPDCGIPWRIRIDRVDEAGDGKVCLMDYKSGAPQAAQLVDKGSKRFGSNGIQLLVYALAYAEHHSVSPEVLLYAWLNVREGKPGYNGAASEESDWGQEVDCFHQTFIAEQKKTLQVLRQGFAQVDLGDGSASAGQQDDYQLLRPQKAAVQAESVQAKATESGQ